MTTTETAPVYTADFRPLAMIAGGWVELTPRDGGLPVLAYVSAGKWLYRQDSHHDLGDLEDMVADYTTGETVGEVHNVGEVFSGWRMAEGE